MKRRKVLLADPSPEFSDSLRLLLIEDFEVWTCRDGAQALTMLDTLCPDVLVTDLALPGVDGLSVLRYASAMTNRPALLVTSCFRSPFIQNALEQIGIDYMMLKPCDVCYLAERVRDLCPCESDVRDFSAWYNATSRFLLDLGIPAGRRGYTYLQIIIEMYRRDPGRSFTKDLYPTAGRDYGATGAAVERSVRGVIETAWLKRDELVWRQYFPTSRFGLLTKPTNRTFIAMVAAVLENMQQRGA